MEWSKRLRLPLALDNAEGKRIAISEQMDELLRLQPQMLTRLQQVKLSDGRMLLMVRLGPPRLPGAGSRDASGVDNGRPPFADAGPRGRFGDGGPPPGERHFGPGGPGGPLDDGPRDRGGRNTEGRGLHPPAWLAPLAWLMPPALALGGATGLILSLLLLFAAVAVGAWPVANRLTRRLKALRQGVETFGSGQLQHRVDVEGKDEVAALASSFNEAAQQIEDLVTSHRSLLANASHELRSPLARLKMATAMLTELPPDRTEDLQKEINRDISELDALVEEVLLASRLDARPVIEQQPLDLQALAHDEAQRVGARVVIDPSFKLGSIKADERLLRRAIRNLLENAKRYGGNTEPIELDIAASGKQQRVLISVCDRGPGVPPNQRERIFEPFYRMPGHAEHAGGVGLGLSLVRQIAQRHGGEVRCEDRQGGGTRFVIELPLIPA